MHRKSHKSQAQSVTELRARQMRSALTPSEQKLWAEIRGGRLGVSFRRQLPLGNYIADFAAPAAKLVVEVDGAYHSRHQYADARRDRNLRRLGYRVLRLQASLVVSVHLDPREDGEEHQAAAGADHRSPLRAGPDRGTRGRKRDRRN